MPLNVHRLHQLAVDRFDDLLHARHLTLQFFWQLHDLVFAAHRDHLNTHCARNSFAHRSST